MAGYEESNIPEDKVKHFQQEDSAKNGAETASLPPPPLNLVASSSSLQRRQEESKLGMLTKNSSASQSLQKQGLYPQSIPVQLPAISAKQVAQREEEEKEEQVWRIPAILGGGEARTYNEATRYLSKISRFLWLNRARNHITDKWADDFHVLEKRTNVISDYLEEQYPKEKIHDSISFIELGSLNMHTSKVKTVVKGASRDTNKLLKQEVKKIKSAFKLENKIEDLQERLHYGFMSGADPEKLNAITSALSTFTKHKGYVNSIFSWTKELKKHTSGFDIFIKIELLNDAFDKIVGHTKNLIEGVRNIHDLATSKGATGNFAALNQFESALDNMDLGLGIVNCLPVFGMMWSSYYKPMTKECLKQLKYIAKKVNKQNKNVALLSWSNKNKNRMRDGSPKIPNKMKGVFPGEQAVLSYMWKVMKKRNINPNKKVRKFFLDHKDQFNAGVPDGKHKLSDQSSATKDPRTWGDREIIGLKTFTHTHKQMVWAMLYGSLSHNI